MLQLRDIKKNYIIGQLKIKALKGVSLDFRKNEFVAILGQSGSGKTTLMNLIGGLDQYTSGDLLINGKSTKDFLDKDWDNYRNKRIGFIFQSYNLIPHQTVIANVELAMTLSGISSEERKKRAIEVLTEVGLDDQLYKKPNQLSGGQMQRVAIARALVNNPEVLLADEPTGALDTKTSEQIMNLIKKVASDRLVIMVTHNPDLAASYANRVIKMSDGLITDDSNPYDASKDVVFKNQVESIKQIEKQTKKKTRDKTSMSFTTALSLSLKNLFTKKGRTILTAIAGSIGIIGVALILSLSTGMNNYIDKIQRDTLSSNPLTISETAFDLNAAMSALEDIKVFEKFPTQKKVFVEQVISAEDVMKRNDITESYITFLEENLKEEWVLDVTYQTGLTLDIYDVKDVNETKVYSKLQTEAQSGGPFGGGASPWTMLVNDDFINDQYDVIEGRLPKDKSELVLIVDQYNKVSETVLERLGLKEAGDDLEEVDFSTIFDKEYELTLNDQIYVNVDGVFRLKAPQTINFDETLTLKVVGIIRQNEQTDQSVHSTGFGYMKELYNYVQTESMNSEIVSFMKDNPNLNPLTGTAINEATYKTVLRMFGGNDIPNTINIYPSSFEAKENIKETLINYNKENKDSAIYYTDLAELLGNFFQQMVNTVSYVLIAFTSISLVVSSIMIGIITYVSVLERTKEIGILRAIGARKKDITRVFNAETFLIGGLAGFIGVFISYLLSFPINSIVYNLTEVKNISTLSLPSAIVLIVISIGLTVLAGLIPARGASKKDPVLALRTE
ncbi:putative carbohydrate ABC transporter-like,ATP-binding/permease protein [Paracholeplasma brassicae]|uniref:Putative carbohydrate ABC transporter-like,ATP-binding/permease protein n=1 Tax=Acholeplasma brassicae TaxID=61635 RepID=U4KSS6_9MOLU|nr:ABC transporter ATP-binding protein/permease [Paracholeplasma brassicae]CCV65454.1 putative carbohydrate ABC transporter-like,ATP-binding/permease protein [Paracholeplasma brassicae]